MSTNLCLRSGLAGLKFTTYRRGCHKLAWLVFAGCCILSMRPAHAQVPTDAITQLSMLDGPPTDDLIRLSTAYADALRDVKAARLSIDTVKTLRPSTVVTNLEVQIANLNLEAADRKLMVLRQSPKSSLLPPKTSWKSSVTSKRWARRWETARVTIETLCELTTRRP